MSDWLRVMYLTALSFYIRILCNHINALSVIANYSNIEVSVLGNESSCYSLQLLMYMYVRIQNLKFLPHALFMFWSFRRL